MCSSVRIVLVACVWFGFQTMGMGCILSLVLSRCQHFFHTEKIGSGHRLWGQSFGSNLCHDEVFRHFEQRVGHGLFLGMGRW